MRTAQELGLKSTNHTDSPVVPPDMLFLVWTAVNRVTRSGQILGPEERVNPYVALKAITDHAAHQYFEEHLKGTIEVGKLADLVILNRNPLKTEPMEIKDIRVLRTLKSGDTLFTAEADKEGRLVPPSAPMQHTHAGDNGTDEDPFREAKAMAALDRFGASR